MGPLSQGRSPGAASRRVPRAARGVVNRPSTSSARPAGLPSSPTGRLRAENRSVLGRTTASAANGTRPARRVHEVATAAPDLADEAARVDGERECGTGRVRPDPASGDGHDGRPPELPRRERPAPSRLALRETDAGVGSDAATEVGRVAKGRLEGREAGARDPAVADRERRERRPEVATVPGAPVRDDQVLDCAAGDAEAEEAVARRGLPQPVGGALGRRGRCGGGGGGEAEGSYEDDDDRAHAEPPGRRWGAAFHRS